MTHLIIPLLLLALFHFVYESILAPSFRLKLRFELFGLRDELRHLKIEHGEDLDDRHFEYLQSSLNTLISVLYRFDVATLAAVGRQMRRDPEVQRRVDSRVRILDDCPIGRCKEIRSRSLRIAATALAVNNGAWCLYLLPVALCVTGVKKLKRLIKASLSLPAPEIDSFAPASNSHLISLG